MRSSTSTTILLRPLVLLLVCVLGAGIGCAAEEAQPEPSDPAAPAVEEQQPRRIDRMQGKWQSREDEAAVVEIDEDQFISWYDEEKLSTGTLAFVNDCEAQTADPEGDYFVVTDEAGALCYYLVHVDETLLEYSYVARGNTLSYTKLE